MRRHRFYCARGRAVLFAFRSSVVSTRNLCRSAGIVTRDNSYREKCKVKPKSAATAKRGETYPSRDVSRSQSSRALRPKPRNSGKRTEICRESGRARGRMANVGRTGRNTRGMYKMRRETSDRRAELCFRCAGVYTCHASRAQNIFFDVYLITVGKVKSAREIFRAMYFFLIAIVCRDFQQTLSLCFSFVVECNVAANIRNRLERS